MISEGVEMKKMELNENWSLSFVHPENGKPYTIPAVVPGNVELDLHRAGVIGGDLTPPDEEHAFRWIDIVDWTYRKEFEFTALPAGMEKAELVFEGIDTAAEIFLNGESILECANMFIAHRVDVTGKLLCGKNELKVIITAPEIAARRYPAPPPFHWTPREPSVYLRKARHMWGGDNAPHRLSAGIWRGVALEFTPAIAFESVYVETVAIDKEEDQAELRCCCALKTPDRDLSDYLLWVRLKRKGAHVYEKSFPVLHTTVLLTQGKVIIPHPELWWPAGSGEAALYDFELTLEKSGNVVAQHTHRLGIRKIRLERSEVTDMSGNGEFQFYCNDEKIYIRGTNWKPLSPWHSQTPEKLLPALELAKNCNSNLIRVWGGGVYEDHEFFDYCDENGLMVWQDFMLACEFPPQEEFFLKEMAKEAEAIIVKLRNHPSLAIWCGDNETDYAFFWNAISPNLLPSHNRVTREVLPNAVRNFDPGRDYLPSSPYIADAAAAFRRYRRVSGDDVLPSAPEQHIYTSGPDLPPGGIREFFPMSAAHLSSETGPIGVNAMSETPEIVARELPRLRRLWNTDPADAACENDLIHQTDRYCAVWIKTARLALRKMFNREFSPDQPEELVAGVNFYVSDFFKYIVESWRVQKFRRSGVVWWSLLDMWPVAFQYSVVDSGFRPKLTYDVLRISQQPLALMGRDPLDGKSPVLCAVNDTRSDCSGTYRIFREDGSLLLQGDFKVAANGVAELVDLPLSAGECCFIEWDSNIADGKNYYLNPGEPYDFDRCCKLSERIRKLI